MAQSAPTAPSVVMNAAGDRKQVPLRDYLNARIAPFLKKAITESLDAEAEYPLQWLGECLINQSILYEGNPDSTGIQERFRYKFNSPTQAKGQDEQQTSAHTETNGTAPAAASQPEIVSALVTPSEVSTESVPISQQNGGTAAETEMKEPEVDTTNPEDTEMAETL